MIEQALFFAIGFLAAALAAVAAAPLVSRRAMRLAVARARLRAPVTEKQAIAEADALRAKHAVEQTRVERKLRLAEEAAADLRVAAGRQAAEIIRLTSAVADLEGALFDQRALAERLQLSEHELKATIGADAIVIHDAFHQRDGARAAEQAAEARAAELDVEASRLRARIAVAAARIEYLEGRVDDLTAATKAARAGIEQTAAELEAERRRSAALEERCAAAAAELKTRADQLTKAADGQLEFARKVAALEERLRLSERAREEALLETGRRLADLADREAALTAATARAAGLEARLAASSAESHLRENAASLRAETVAASHAALEGSLRAARAEREALRRENESLRSRLAALGEASHADDAKLREAIGHLGHEVVRLFAAGKAEDEGEAQGLDEPRRRA